MSKTFLDELLSSAPSGVKAQASKLDLSKVESWNDTIPFIVFLDSLLNWKGADQEIIKYINEKQKLLKDFAALKRDWLKTEAEQQGLKELKTLKHNIKLFRQLAKERMPENDFKAMVRKWERQIKVNAGN